MKSATSNPFCTSVTTTESSMMDFTIPSSSCAYDKTGIAHKQPIKADIFITFGDMGNDVFKAGRKFLMLALCLLIFTCTYAQSFLNKPYSCSHKKHFNHYNENRQNSRDSRSSAIDILSYDINLDITDFANKTIKGNCIIQLQSLQDGLTQIPLDLLALTVDSVVAQGAIAPFTHNDTLLAIDITPINANDTLQLNIYYHGSPVKDASGWGGFYWSGQYAFNLGVGFEANPHNYGRAWFPCIDNFTDKAFYQFNITTASTKKAFCNGLLQSAINNGDGTHTWHWKLNQPIPTYLASVAVANYVTVTDTYTGALGNIPVELGAIPADTNDLKSSFQHLPDALHAFEAAYGPYIWDRIGFVLVPFSSGAMEHATNIAYPVAAANGQLTLEQLMAHEFAHSWWGNQLTCSTAEDMWINEGWASYSEKVFVEHVYGKEAYMEEVRKNHEEALHYAHITDGSYLPVSGVPHEHTYGAHVYDKGADVIHTLRSYMGDDKFFNSISVILADLPFKNINSHQFENFLSALSGIDLSHYFNNWIFNPGWTHFSIDSFEVAQNGAEYKTTVYIRQRLKQAPTLYEQVPLEFTFYGENWDTIKKTVFMSGECGIATFNLDFEPAFIALDLEEKISDAITGEYMIINSIGMHDFGTAKMDLNVYTITDSAFIRVEHNWIGPDGFKSPHPGLHLSTERYWKIDGIIPDSFNATATIGYNGSTSMNGGYLDNKLITNTEDSLVVMYREKVSDKWTHADSFLVNVQSNPSNKIGLINIYNVKKGEYALAIYDAGRPDTIVSAPNITCHSLTAVQNIEEEMNWDLKIHPNPADTFIELSFEPTDYEYLLNIYDVNGRIMHSETIYTNEKGKRISVSEWAKGIYIVKVKRGQSGEASQKVVVLR